MLNVIGTFNIIIVITTNKNDIANLTELTDILHINKTHLGIYTLVTVSRLFLTILILATNVLLKKFHIVSPIKIKAVKYSTDELKINFEINVYINIKQVGSKISQIQLKYEPATSDFKSALVL